MVRLTDRFLVYARDRILSCLFAHRSTTSNLIFIIIVIWMIPSAIIGKTRAYYVLFSEDGAGDRKNLRCPRRRPAVHGGLILCFLGEDTSSADILNKASSAQRISCCHSTGTGNRSLAIFQWGGPRRSDWLPGVIIDGVGYQSRHLFMNPSGVSPVLVPLFWLDDITSEVLTGQMIS